MSTLRFNRKLLIGIVLIGLVLSLSLFVSRNLRASKKSFINDWSSDYSRLVAAGINIRSQAFGQALSNAAIKRTKADVKYDGTYTRVPYPGGDVPSNVGVCTDVLIRSYRALGIDLQKNVHEDMLENFKVYPNLWGLEATDTSIDHRRVPNLMVFFTRAGAALPITDNPEDYLPGDIVAWDTYGLTHIGLVVNVPAPEENRYMIVHNFGKGPELEDFLFSYEIIGHFRYEG